MVLKKVLWIRILVLCLTIKNVHFLYYIGGGKEPAIFVLNGGGVAWGGLIRYYSQLTTMLDRGGGRLAADFFRIRVYEAICFFLELPSFWHFFYFEMQQLTGLMLIDSKWADLQRVQYASSTLTLRTNKLERLLQFFYSQILRLWVNLQPADPKMFD